MTKAKSDKQKLSGVPLRPEALFAFHGAKVLAIVRCPTCRCDHYGISVEDTGASVAATNAFLTELSEAEAIELYGARTVSIKRFTRCFFCHTPAGSMTILGKDEPYSEPSPLPIILEPSDIRQTDVGELEHRM